MFSITNPVLTFTFRGFSFCILDLWILEFDTFIQSDLQTIHSNIHTHTRRSQGSNQRPSVSSRPWQWLEHDSCWAYKDGAEEMLTFKFWVERDILVWLIYCYYFECKPLPEPHWKCAAGQPAVGGSTHATSVVHSALSLSDSLHGWPLNCPNASMPRERCWKAWSNAERQTGEQSNRQTDRSKQSKVQEGYVNICHI